MIGGPNDESIDDQINTLLSAKKNGSFVEGISSIGILNENGKVDYSAALDEFSGYVTGVGLEAGLFEGAVRYGRDAAKNFGPKVTKLASRISSRLGLLGVGISTAQALVDLDNGKVKEAAVHTMDAAVNGTLLGVTAAVPAAAPFTLAAGILYNTWAIFRD